MPAVAKRYTRKKTRKTNNTRKLRICGDLNGHVGDGVEGFESFHEGFGFGKKNVEGEMILEFADALNFVVANTWFEKTREGKSHMKIKHAGMWLITSWSGKRKEN